MYLCTRNYDLKRGGTFETAKAGTFHSVTAGTSIPLFTHNELASRLGNLHAFVAKRLAAFLVTLAGIDELHLALALSRFVAGDDPNVGSNSRIVEQVVGQLNDGFQPVARNEGTRLLASRLPHQL